MAVSWWLSTALGILGAIITENLGYLSTVKRVFETLDRGSLFFDHIRRVRDIEPYSKLFFRHTSLGYLSAVFSETLRDVADVLHDNGLAVLYAKPKTYLFLLETALSDARASFLAVLLEPFPPWWFFHGDEEDIEGLTAAKKQEYLTTVHRTRRMPKIRLLLFKWDARTWTETGDVDARFQDEFFKRLDDVKKFLRFAGDGDGPSDVKHYLLNWPAYARSKQQQQESEQQRPPRLQAIDNIIDQRDDFALIDRSVVIKQRPVIGVQVIPLELSEHAPADNYRKVAALAPDFDDEDESENNLWIRFDEKYLNICAQQKPSRLLSLAEYKDVLRQPQPTNHPQQAAVK